MKRRLSWLLIALMMFGLIAPSAQAERRDRMLRIALAEDPESLDVQMTTATYMVPLNIYDRLLEAETVDGVATIVPGLAKSYDVSDDGLTYTFHLEQGVTFHNGSPFTADDVVFTVERMMDPATLAKNIDVYYGVVKGAAEFHDGEVTGGVSGVRAIDDCTVEFTLVAPYASFPARLATPGASIYDRESTEGATGFGADPELCVGTGPFRVTEWNVGTSVVLEANPDYFRGAPSIDGIEMHIVPDADTARMMYEGGDLDVLDLWNAHSQAEYFRSKGYGDRLVTGREAGLQFWIFNTAVEPLDDVRVRRAIQMAVDRDAILQAVFAGEGLVLNSFLPEGIVGYDPDAEPIVYDPDAARALLDEAGYPDGFDMQIAVLSTNTLYLTLATIFQSYLSNIGVRLEIVQYDQASYYDVRRTGALPSYVNYWDADFNDPDNFLYTFFSDKNTVIRSVNYDNAAVMQRLEDARTMIDEAARIEAYRAVDHAVVHEDAVVLPLFQIEHLFLLGPRVTGFKVAWNAWGDMSFYGVGLTD